MLSDFVMSASTADSIKAEAVALNETFRLATEQRKQSQGAAQDNAPQQLLQVRSITSVQKGAPEAKFKPEAANQQIDKLMRVNIRQDQQGGAQNKQHLLPPRKQEEVSSSVVDYKLNGYIEMSDNLKQCSSILANPNSVKELVYWETHEHDYGQLSQWYNNAESRYLTFEPDTGGFTSQRMVLEQVIALAYALGRTLVLPPRQGMRDGTLLSYDDFFDLRSNLSQKYKGLRIVTMEEFLQYVGLPGYLRNAQGMASLPPWNRVNWDSAGDIGMLYDYLRTVGTVPLDWNPQKCIIGYREDQLKKSLNRIYKRTDGRKPPSPLDFQGKATPVTAPEVERLREFLAERQQVCTTHQDSVVLHIPTTAEGKSLLHAPFYSFFFFDDYHQDLLVKRMIRDHVRYNDVIVCAAARIIDWLRLHGGVYDAIHIRGPSYEDLHSDVNTNPEWIIHEISKYIPKGTTLYIATDHADPSYFDPLREQYKLYFAADFKGVFDSLLPWYLEMVEQFICSRSRTFVGTYYSTFSAYTNRLRGYYSQRDELEGYEDGMIQSFYSSPVSVKKDMKLYKSLRKPLTMREFPIAWRDINHGVAAPAAKKAAPKALDKNRMGIIPLASH
jgi:hypothetical protein